MKGIAVCVPDLMIASVALVYDLTPISSVARGNSGRAE